MSVCFTHKYIFTAYLLFSNILVFIHLKTIDQFERDGCDNCEKFLHIRNDREFVMTCTSSNFDG